MKFYAARNKSKELKRFKSLISTQRLLNRLYTLLCLAAYSWVQPQTALITTDQVPHLYSWVERSTISDILLKDAILKCGKCWFRTHGPRVVYLNMSPRLYVWRLFAYNNLQVVPCPTLVNLLGKARTASDS